jgi:hypothetical protein
MWLDSTPDLRGSNGTQDHCVDADHPPTDLAVGHCSVVRAGGPCQAGDDFGIACPLRG